jgi:hypothetical protein
VNFMVHDKVQWRAAVNIKNVGKVLIKLANVSFSRRTVLHYYVIRRKKKTCRHETRPLPSSAKYELSVFKEVSLVSEASVRIYKIAGIVLTISVSLHAIALYR